MKRVRYWVGKPATRWVLMLAGLAGLVLLSAAQFLAPVTGPALAAAGVALGVLVGWGSRQPALDLAGVEAATLRDGQAKGEAIASRLTALEANVATLRHDLRGILSPALLTADRLAGSPDPVVKRASEVIVRTVERATARLAETK